MKRIFKFLTCSFVCLAGVLTVVSCKNNHKHNVEEENWVRDSSSHWHACEGCDELFDLSVHAYDEFVKDEKECKQSHTCTVCGYVQTVTVAHTFGEWGSRTDGYGRECTHCHHVEYLTQYYVKGTMNNWSENDDYKFVIDAANMKASLTVKLAAGDKFKVADASWSKEFNGKTIIAAEGLFKGEGDIEVVASGTYTFVITDLGGEAKCNVTAVLGEDEPTVDVPTTGGDEPTADVPTQGGDEPTVDVPTTGGDEPTGDVPTEEVVVKYSVTYVINGHGEQPANLTEATALPSVLPSLVEEGYIFEGWYYDVELTDEALANDVLERNETLYAKWSKDSIVNQTNAIEMNGVAYDTIAAALAAIPTTGDTNTYTIRLNKGTYAENGLSYNGTATIHIIGNTNTKYGTDVIIKGRGNNMGSMRGRELLEIQGSGNIILENVSLVSDYSRSETTKDAQAEVLGTDTKGNTVAYNCSFISHQDTLRTAGKAWFYGCYIEGDTDFIWMEAAGSVALYEKCEIVSVYDEHAGTHASYVAAPRMGVSSKVGKGLVFLNSTITESAEAKENGQLTYLARSPWSEGFYNQVAYINTICSDVEVESTSKAPNAPWYGNMIETDYPKTIIGWKMDSKTAASLNISGKDYIIDDAITAKEFNGRKAILNRIYNTGKQRYEKDAANNWDIDALIASCGFVVDADKSSDILEGEVVGESTVYLFNGSVDLSTICNGFKQDGAKAHYVGQNGHTITIPLNGKSYVEVYGYYAGTVEVKADTQGYSVAFFNNGSTNTEIQHDYIVFDENATELVITAKATTYITKIVVTEDATIPAANPVTSIEIERSTVVETVGVPVTLSAVLNKDATNKAVVWSSSDTEVASIDPYSGRVTFKKAGAVTFTVTACDGSGVTKSIDCNPAEATWTVAEWYTTDNKDIANEEGAEGINNFSTGNSAYKGLGATYTFTNLAGETISTQNGLKLNSAGKMSIAITKYALLTIVTCNAGKVFATPVVSNGTITVSPMSITKSADEKVYTYVYEIEAIGMWDIVRGDTSSENNPILYAKCEYVEKSISEPIGITFKGSHYTESKTGIANIVTPSEAIDASESTVDIKGFKFEGCASNGGNVSNWLDFPLNATITFKVDKACTLLIGYYSALQTVTINGVEVEGNKTSVKTGDGEIVEYEIEEAGTVVIKATASSNGYLGFVGVLFKTLEQKKADAIAKLDAAYPASKYTQNTEYATVLAAQKAAINAAEDAAALKAAYAAAVVAMDALEVDKEKPITDPAIIDNTVLSFVTPADLESVQNNPKVTIEGNVRHNGAEIQIEGTISFMVKAGTVVIVNPYKTSSYVSYTIGAEGEENLETFNVKATYTAVDDCTIVYTGLSNNYLVSIEVICPVSNQTYVFGGASLEGDFTNVTTSTANLTIVGSVRDNGDSIQISNSNFINFLVAPNSKVVVTGHSKSYGQLKFIVNEEVLSVESDADGVYTFVVAEGGSVSITALNVGTEEVPAYDKSYIKALSVIVEKPEVYGIVNTIWYFDNNEENKENNAYAYRESVQGNSLEWKGLSIDATAQNAKLAYNASGYAQFNAATKISFAVAANATVTIISYTGQYKYTVNGVAATANETVVQITEAGTVEIIATGTAYIYSISVSY